MIVPQQEAIIIVDNGKSNEMSPKNVLVVIKY